MKLGWLPDPTKHAEDQPDHDAQELLGASTFPDAASCASFIVEILDQGRLSSCVANAGFGALRASMVRQQMASATTAEEAAAVRASPPPLGSRLFGYFLARAKHGATAIDAGTHIRYLFEALNALGFCPESVFPYDDGPGDGRRAPFQAFPPSIAFAEAAAQRAHAMAAGRAPAIYRRIYTTGYARVDDVKRANAQGHTVVFGTDVSRAFVRGHLGDDPVMPPTDDIAGGHAMLIAGYNGDTFSVVNSWGCNWGENGWCRMAAEYIAADATRDLWIVESAPVYLR